MRATATEAQGVLTVHVTGELDALSANELRPGLDRLLEEARERLVVDISGLRLLDSSGVGILVYLFRKLRASGRAFAVRGASEQPLAILRLMKLDQIFFDDDGPKVWRAADM